MSQEAVTIVKTLYDRFKAGDLAGALSVVHPNVVWDEGDGHPYGPAVRGVNDVVERIFKRLKSEWDGIGTHTEEFLDCRDHVVVLGRDRATFKRTGKTLECRVVHVFHVQDGRIVSFTQYCDTHAWHVAMSA